MRTLYKIDSYPETYFVLRDFQQSLGDTSPNFRLFDEQLMTMPSFPANSPLRSRGLPVNQRLLRRCTLFMLTNQKFAQFFRRHFAILVGIDRIKVFRDMRHFGSFCLFLA